MVFVLTRSTDQRLFLKNLQKKYNSYRFGLDMPSSNARERCVQILQKQNDWMPYRYARYITSLLSL
jgi:hypothetical protein